VTVKQPYSQKPQLDELDAGTKHLSIRLEELKNSLQPIQQLPPDVIIEIATYLDPRACGGDYQPLMAMSQTCRYWRETLTSNPASWHFISSEYMDVVPLCLDRSGSYPLEVELSTDTMFYNTIRHIGPHVDRLATLRCRLEEANAVSLQTLFQLDHSPNLHTLSIRTDRAPTVDPQAIEMALVSGDMPSLRTLELLPFPVIPQFVEFKHLTNLRLDVIYSTLTNVLDLLAANPLLEKVRLLGNFEESEDTRAAGSILLGHLQFLAVERCTPCTFLETLAFPRNARIFIRYNLVSHFIPFAFTLPRSMGEYANLQGLTSLHVLVAFHNDTCIDATGPNGSIAIRFMDLQDASPVCDAIASLSTTGITQFVYELHPALTGMEIDKVTRMMDMLPYLEEIVLVHFGGTDMQEFLSALKNTNGWIGLLRLKFVHCRHITDWIGDLIEVAAERMDDDLVLGTVTVVCEGVGQEQELFGVLEGFVGALDLVEVGTGEMTRSEQVWDDTSCTTRLTSLPV
jgi:hypothetical protein